MNTFKKIVSILPQRWQYEMKRIHFHRQINQGNFLTDEPEYNILDDIVSASDWVVDVGANVGHYTKRLSELVGPKGRVIAFEPILETFSILSENVRYLKCENVTLINAALSDETKIVGFEIPVFDTGLKNYYQAHLSQSPDSGPAVMTFQLDSFQLKNKISLIKIDAEGHESSVLNGMRDLLSRDKPTLIVETSSPEIQDMLARLGYKSEVLDGSPNIIFRFGSNA